MASSCCSNRDHGRAGVGGRSRTADGASQTFERASLAATAFSALIQSVPRSRSRLRRSAGLLFGFPRDGRRWPLRRRRRATRRTSPLRGRRLTLLVTGLWLAQGYTSSAWTTADACIGILVVLYASLQRLREIARRPLAGDGQWPPTRRRSCSSPSPCWAVNRKRRHIRWRSSPTLFALGGIIAWQAIASTRGRTALCRRLLHARGDRHLVRRAPHRRFANRSRCGSTVRSACLRSWCRCWRDDGIGRSNRGKARASCCWRVLGLLLFSPPAGRSAVALGFAILLSILNAAIFVESAAGRMPAVAIGGGLLSWAVLGVWWPRAVSAVGLVPAIHARRGARAHSCSPVTLGPNRLAERRSPATGTTAEPVRFRDGLFLSLIAHAFLLYAAMGAEHTGGRPAVFIALTVLTLAMSAVTLLTRTAALHAAGVAATSVVVVVWSRVRRRERHHNRHCRHRGRFAYALASMIAFARAGLASPAPAVSAVVALLRRRNGGDPHDAALTGDQRDAAGRNPRDQSRGARRVVVAAAMAGGGFGGHGALLVCHGNDGDCRPDHPAWSQLLMFTAGDLRRVCGGAVCDRFAHRQVARAAHRARTCERRVPNLRPGRAAPRRSQPLRRPRAGRRSIGARRRAAATPPAGSA